MSKIEIDEIEKPGATIHFSFEEMVILANILGHCSFGGTKRNDIVNVIYENICAEYKKHGIEMRDVYSFNDIDIRRFGFIT